MSEFDKIIGYDGIKLELRRMCDVIKNPDKYAKLGVHVPKGLMIEGDPGLGKTLMATCFIKESGCKTYTIRKDIPNGEFVKHIKDTYEKAKSEKMAIVFLDDIDKFANEDQDHCDAEEYVTVQSCMDECTDNNVFTIATANEAYRLPDSLKRAGRFDKVIEIESPEGSNAHKIVKHFLQSKKVVKDLDIEEITRYLEDYSCAEIESLLNEAGIYAGFDGRNRIELKDIIEAILRNRFGASFGEENDDQIDMREVAVHEAGHALVFEVLSPGFVDFISIVRNGGGTKGTTVYSQRHEKSTKYIENRLASALGGKAAVEAVYEKPDSGCQNDLGCAYEYASDLVDDMCVFGFDAYVNRFSADFTKANKDRTVQSLVRDKYELARQIIVENRDFLDAIVEELLEKETLTYKDIERIRKGRELVLSA
ncbi:MAG: AAA family ATPase [Lachnospiraceae bacterium]|nr:AAA family ATPase [Lachnospiraceae bacterium]